MSDETAEPDGAREQAHPSADDLFYQFVTDHFANVEVTGTSQKAVWCPRWYDHPEVVARLHALWDAHDAAEARQFDEAHPDLSAMSDWWLHHWDPHRHVLFDKANGPFRDCDPRRGHLFDRTRGRAVEVIPIRPDAHV